MRIALLLALAFTTSAIVAAERQLAVPTDAKARYTILEIGGNHPNKTIVTRRVGSSGTTYSKRIYNCLHRTVKYLGSGDTLAEMNASNPDPKMASIVDLSIADYVGREACKR